MLNKVIVNIAGDDAVLCEVINARLIRLRFSSLVIPQYKDDIIYELRIGEGSLALFDEISVPIDSKIKSVYKINKIEKLTDRGYAIYSSIATKTKQFILPCICNTSTNKEYFLLDTFFENAYIDVSNKATDLGTLNPLILLYRYSESEVYRAFETRIRKHPLFIKTIDVNKYQVLFIFDISSFKNDVELFKQGAYSKLSPELKSKILSFYQYSKEGKMYQILYKSAKLREQLEIVFDVELNPRQELYSKPEIIDETYFN